MIINTFKLKFGHGAGRASEKINATPVTVFVGPNNSGKSKILLEIEQCCSFARPDYRSEMIEEMEFYPILGKNAAEKELEKVISPIRPGEALSFGSFFMQVKQRRVQINKELFLEVLQEPSKNLSWFGLWLSAFTTFLSGGNRITLISDQPAGDMQQPPNSSLQKLLRSDEKRLQVRKILNDAFGFFFVIDPTNLGHLRIKASDRAPNDVLEERGIHDKAIVFHQNAKPLSTLSDGVKAFTGIIMEIVAGDPRVVIIDEPEAFLHPALAFKLGNEIAKIATDVGKNVFVATHSPNFLMGCIAAGAQVNIIRLTYTNSNATSRLLRNSDIVRLMRNPLLRSTGVLSGLFYEFIIVTEADADRAFYQEINERLIRFMPEHSIPNCLFLNCQGKSTIKTIIEPLRRMGIPAACIIDIDIVKNGGREWTELMDALNVPQALHLPLGQLRSSINNLLNASGRDMKTDGGIKLLNHSDKEAAENLLMQLAEYGMFVVPCGEVESWLGTLDIKGHGPSWLIKIFEKMGEDPDAEDYLQPTLNDVWSFISSIKNWLVNPKRKGIPI